MAAAAALPAPPPALPARAIAPAPAGAVGPAPAVHPPELVLELEPPGQLAHVVGLLVGHEGHAGAGPPGSAGAPHPVGVGVLVLGGVEVDDVCDVVDVEP